MHGHDRSERPDRECERGRDRDSGSGSAGESENLKEKLTDLNARLNRTAQLGLLTARNAGEARSALQVVFFLTGLTRERVKEVVSNYQADRDAVMARTRDKGLSLKLRIYDAILKRMMETTGQKGGEALEVAKEIERCI